MKAELCPNLYSAGDGLVSPVHAEEVGREVET